MSAARAVFEWMQMVHRPLGLSTGPRELLRNPGETGAQVRTAGKTLEMRAILSARRARRVRASKPLNAGRPRFGIEAVAAEDAEPGGDPCALDLGRLAGNSRCAGKAQQAAGAAQAEMAITVEADDSAGAFEGAHAAPEIRVGRRQSEFGVAIQGDNGETNSAADGTPR